ncbi:MAG TPA: UDP-N-acetylmuramoyl-tripeptide--D-alanyl-D-alanine ligase [Bacteroidota bacterium]
MKYITTEELYNYYKNSSGVQLMPDRVRSGDLFIAYQRNRPLNKTARIVWDAVETVSPWFLKIFIRFIVRYGLSITVNPDRIEGNRHGMRALSKGASLAVLDNPHYCTGPQMVLVHDAREALMKLAARHRQTLKISCVGITGSNGKTTTRELVKHVLGSHLKTVGTEGEANSDTGVSTTVLSMSDSVDVAVLEMGLMRRGDLTQLCVVAQPTCGLITSIGRAHLKHLKNIEGVTAAKNELFQYLQAHQGHIFLNLDDDRISALASGYQQLTTYGSGEKASIRGAVLSSDPFLNVRWFIPESINALKNRSIDIQTRLAGKHNLSNVLAAIAVGRHFQVPPEKIVAALENFQPLANRFQLIPSGTNTIILDARSANSGSMLAAIEGLVAMKSEQKLAILGDLGDLGTKRKEEHRIMLRKVKSSGLDNVVFVGKEFMRVRDRAFGTYFLSTDEAKKWYQSQQFDKTCILLKGAHALHIEKILEP